MIAAALLAATALATGAQASHAAPQNCSQALTAVKSALQSRAAPRYYAKTVSDPATKRRYKARKASADRAVNAARAALKVQCQGVGTTAALDATCAGSIADLDHLYDLRIATRVQQGKIKSRGAAAKARRAALSARLRQLEVRIAAQNSAYRKSCRGESGTSGGSPSTPIPPTGPTGPTTPTEPVDTTPPAAPDVTIPGTNPAGYNNLASPSVFITAPTGETGGVPQCRISGSGYSGTYTTYKQVTAPWTLPALADGKYTVGCRWVDDAGNVGQSVLTSITFDRTPPAAPLVAGPSAATSDTTPSFNLSGAGDGESYECRADGGGSSSSTNLYTAPALSTGGHTIECRLIDLAGNQSAFASAQVTIDPSAIGTVTIAGPETAGQDMLTLTLTPSGAYSYIGCDLDGGTIYSLTSPVVLPSLSAGSHTVNCRLVSAENVSGPVSSYTVKILAG